MLRPTVRAVLFKHTRRVLRSARAPLHRSRGALCVWLAWVRPARASINISSQNGALRTLGKLSSLELAHNHIGDTGAADLGETLRTNATLKALKLDVNDIGDTAAALLVEALHTRAMPMILWLNGRHTFGRRD